MQLLESFKEAVGNLVSPPEEQGGISTDTTNTPAWKQPNRRPTHWIEGPFYHNRTSNRAKVFGTPGERRDDDVHAAYRAWLARNHRENAAKFTPLAPMARGSVIHQHMSAPTWLERKNA